MGDMSSLIWRLEVFSPSFGKIDNIDAIRSSLPQVRVHVNLQVLASYMTLCRKEVLDVLRSRIEYCGQIGRSTHVRDRECFWRILRNVQKMNLSWSQMLNLSLFDTCLLCGRNIWVRCQVSQGQGQALKVTNSFSIW